MSLVCKSRFYGSPTSYSAAGEHNHAIKQSNRGVEMSVEWVFMTLDSCQISWHTIGSVVICFNKVFPFDLARIHYPNIRIQQLCLLRVPSTSSSWFHSCTHACSVNCQKPRSPTLKVHLIIPRLTWSGKLAGFEATIYVFAHS